MSGILISFEGTEGSGKSTQVERLAAALLQSGRLVRVTREPGGTAIGEEIRRLLKHGSLKHEMAAETELLLMNASRGQLVREVIRPALAAGEIVLCDRFYDSTMAYQGYGRGLDLTLVREIIDSAVGDTRPDLTVLLAIPVELSERRRASRSAADTTGLEREAPRSRPRLEPDRFEAAGADFFRRVEAGYEELARVERPRVCRIDGTGSVEGVAEAIRELVGRRFGLLSQSMTGGKP